MSGQLILLETVKLKILYQLFCGDRNLVRDDTSDKNDRIGQTYRLLQYGNTRIKKKQSLYIFDPVDINSVPRMPNLSGIFQATADEVTNIFYE